MKRLFLVVIVISIIATINAQAPAGFNYQAVARNAQGQLITNTQVNFQIAILKGSIAGTSVFTETFSPTTNNFGLVNLNIGNGALVSGSFSDIDWGADTYFIKVWLNGTEMGTTQLLSVPYALYARKAENGFSGSYNDLTNQPDLFDGQYNSLTGVPTFAVVATTGSYNSLNNKPTLFSGTYSDLSGKPTTLTGYGITDAMSTSHAANGITTTNITNWNNKLSSYTETDPVFALWNKSAGISITASQVSDFTTGVTNNTAVLANTAKNSYPTADQTKLAAITGTNTGDNATNTLYSGLVTNATHTGDATGDAALTVVRINGTSLAGLATGILKNTTSTGVPSIAVAGTDYLTPTGSAALLTNFPILNQNTTGSSASFTGSLAGQVTGTQGATVVTNAAVIEKVLTGYVSGAGTVAATDNILQAIQKLNGNNPMHYIGESYGGGKVFYVYDNGQHGLIAATADQSTGVVWTNTSFQSTVSNAVRDGINGGLANTERIIIQAGGGSYAALLCANYKGGNFADWYSPTKYELNLLYLQKGVVGGFASSYYWSSTEGDNNTAWGQYFTYGTQGSYGKYTTPCVRAVRAF
jgi:hypothetical protein